MFAHASLALDRNFRSAPIVVTFLWMANYRCRFCLPILPRLVISLYCPSIKIRLASGEIFLLISDFASIPTYLALASTIQCLPTLTAGGEIIFNLAYFFSVWSDGLASPNSSTAHSCSVCNLAIEPSHAFLISLLISGWLYQIIPRRVLSPPGDIRLKWIPSIQHPWRYRSICLAPSPVFALSASSTIHS